MAELLVKKSCPRVQRQALVVAKFYGTARQKIAPAHPWGVDGEVGTQLPCHLKRHGRSESGGQWFVIWVTLYRRKVRFKATLISAHGARVQSLNTYMEVIYCPRMQEDPYEEERRSGTAGGDKLKRALPRRQKNYLPTRRKITAGYREYLAPMDRTDTYELFGALVQHVGSNDSAGEERIRIHSPRDTARRVHMTESEVDYPKLSRSVRVACGTTRREITRDHEGLGNL
ncbi:hypothetical protein B0F90DRAFT_1668460 [Multifurca ochricompacta]|uniref:Uncharacterized protein n=1 Tax=Multifurca ochricompacta TaxID=376703 RepID=A0AAD4M393_9AGAM|nr:hypothetical protein B0F90DRAFT_1668460 [Multifurca ochricompacta]